MCCQQIYQISLLHDPSPIPYHSLSLLFVSPFFSVPFLKSACLLQLCLLLRYSTKFITTFPLISQKPPSTQTLSTGRGTQEIEEPVKEEPDAGRDNHRSWNTGSSQVEPSFPGLQGPGDICIVQTSHLWPLYKSLVYLEAPWRSQLGQGTAEQRVQLGAAFRQASASTRPAGTLESTI